MSYNSKAFWPESTPGETFSSISFINKLIPLSSVSLNLISSSFIVFSMINFWVINSGNASPICSIKDLTNLNITGSLAPKRCVWRIALLIILLSTYPRPSLLGKTPSAIKKEIDLKWSATTLWDTILSFVFSTPVTNEEALTRSFIISVS